MIKLRKVLVIVMKKCELLSPAGNMEMLKYAVEYGADAVYLAGVKFGARRYATNFTDEEMIDAVRYAHLYGVKVYVTINTLVYESEIDEFVEYVKSIHSIGVDAVLVQDFGMLNLIHRIMPNLELHASTQMHNNGKDMLELLKSCGVKRAVLDREMGIEEVRSLPSDIEKEVFIHGALCVSYSGQCLFSSKVLNRSGNRGECAGMCRLPYKIEGERDAKYYLSLKDLCSIDNIDKIIEAGVDSLKIEGRMKSPEYVGYITKVYRRMIDDYYEGHFRGPSTEEMRNIKILFNRGLTKGYLNGAQNEEMANLESPNHVGVHLGRYSLDGKKVKLVLDDDLYQGDVIRFKEDSKGMTVNFLYNRNDKLISKGCKGETVWIDNFLELEKKGEMRLVGSSLLNKEIGNFKGRKVQITGEIKLQMGSKIRLKITDGTNVVCKEGAVVEKAKSAPISKDDVIRQMGKVGSTVYELLNLDVELDEEVFVNVRDLNALRREALDLLTELRKNDKKEVIILDDENPDNFDEKEDVSERLKVVVETEEQYDVAKKFTSEIYSSNKKLLEEIADLRPKYEEKPSTIDENKYMISDFGTLLKSKDGDVLSTDYMLNVTNSKTVLELLKKNVSLISLSLEITDHDLKEISRKTDSKRLELFVYGRVELMKMKYDPVKGTERNVLIDRNGKKFPIKKTSKFNYLLSCDRVDRIDKIQEYSSFGISHFRVDLYDEDRTESEKILQQIYAVIIKKLQKE